MLVTSRSFAEYEAMFGLTALPASVLDCCAGGSGFTAEAARRGVDAVAADPAYGLPVAELAEAVRRGTTAGGSIVGQNADHFVWDWYGSPAARDDIRAEAAKAFLADRELAPERYVAASLPELPFPDGRFELVLCSHLLFTWADVFGLDWHLRALREMVRVCDGEVRVFPLVHQGAGEPVAFLPELLERLALPTEVRQVPYEFQRDANKMLVISKL
ncbi:class I SAM-dependent methyltransferase [Kribbella deserti]|uniref:Class I SAM-dependent methyltransferase n=1 Tax=Kribbella deserti TaxID=1926257 RepID=A0ABV6QS81_9ACTN